MIAGDAVAALTVATEALRLAPADADAHVLLGIILGKLDRREESTAAYEEALRLEPGHAQALWQLVRIQEDADANSKRSAALFGCLVMLGMFGWLVWSLPRYLWRPLLRQREFRSLKIYLGLGVVVLGVLGAFTLGHRSTSGFCWAPC